MNIFSDDLISTLLLVLKVEPLENIVQWSRSSLQWSEVPAENDASRSEESCSCLWSAWPRTSVSINRQWQLRLLTSVTDGQWAISVLVVPDTSRHGQKALWFMEIAAELEHYHDVCAYGKMLVYIITLHMYWYVCIEIYIYTFTYPYMLNFMTEWRMLAGGLR